MQDYDGPNWSRGFLLVCLDTSVLVPLLRKEDMALDRLRDAVDKGVRVSTTVVSLCELYGGAFSSSEPARELGKVEKIISSLEVLELNQLASRKYGELLNSNPIKTQPIGDFDLVIAAIALSNSEGLATRNSEHFQRVSGLQVERW